jgi:DNA-binding transcriptional ArsR family regulator
MEELPFDKSLDFSRESEILKVLGHPVRLKIVAGLMSQSCNVKKIWECLGLPQATVSQHLALLKNKSIISGRREGVEVFYQVTCPEAQKVVGALLSGMFVTPEECHTGD